MVLRLLLFAMLALSAQATPSCYGPRQTHGKAYDISMIDCADVLERMLAIGIPTQPVVWSSEMGNIPYTWAANSCAVNIFLANGARQTIASPFSVAETATEIMRACLAIPSSTSLGGQEYLSHNSDMAVTLTANVKLPPR